MPGKKKSSDLTLLVEMVDELIWRVYRMRYKDLDHGQTAVMRRGKRWKGRPEVVNLQLSDGTLIVDFETFENTCWDEIKEKRLLTSGNFQFQDNDHLRRYLQTTFENLLQKMIYETTPGLVTRKKQVDRVLTPICLFACKDYCDCWKLRVYHDKTLTPADLETLQKAARGLRAPEAHYPKGGSERGPSIKDQEMKDYLASLLTRAGGMTRRNDLLEFIKQIYGLETVKRLQPVPGDEDRPDLIEKDTGDTGHSGSELLLAPDHILMAKDLFGRMESELKDIFYHRVIMQKSLGKTAKTIGLSTTTIHNRMEDIKRLFFSYFRGNNLQAAVEEANAVIQLLSEMIVHDRKRS